MFVGLTTAALSNLYRGATESIRQLTISPLDMNIWAAAQAQFEFEHLRAVLHAARLGDPQATLARIQLRIDIIHSRLDVLSDGDVHEVLSRLAQYQLVQARLRGALGAADALLERRQEFRLPDLAARIDEIFEPIEKIVRQFTVEVVQASAAWRIRHEEELAKLLDQLRLVFMLFAAGIATGGFLLLRQNRRLVVSDSETRRMLDELRRAHAATSRFLANMSHELRTPLNAVMGFADIMRRQLFGPLPARYEGYVKDIYGSAEHLLGLIEDVLDVARPEAERRPLNEAWHHLDEIVDSAAMVVKQQAADSDIEFSTRAMPLLDVHADERALRQVLVNLMSNGVKYTDRGGRVTCHADTTASGELEIVIEDTGMGIPVADLPYVTNPFHRAANAVVAAVGGTGLGLTIVKTLTELHGGRLDLVSALGAGTQARVTLPAARVRRLALPEPARQTA